MCINEQEVLNIKEGINSGRQFVETKLLQFEREIAESFRKYEEQNDRRENGIRTDVN